MNRLLTSIVAALEAVITVAIGVGIAFVPVSLIWAIEYGLTADFSTVWGAVGDAWLLGHGVDLTVRLDDVAAARVGFAGSGDPFQITIAALGLGAITAISGGRLGHRSAESGRIVIAVASSTAVVAALGALIGATAGTPTVAVALGQAIVLPAFVWVGGAAIGVVWAVLSRRVDREHADLDHRDRVAADRNRLIRAISERTVDLPVAWRGVLAGALRIGCGTAASVIAIGALALAAVLAANYATVAGLYQSLHADVLGGASVTLAELAILPNLVIWAASWLLGPGFAIGSGTSVSPAGTVLGPVPGLPVFGALPSDGGIIGYLGILVPVVIAFLLAMRVRQGLMARGIAASPTQLIVLVVGSGVVSGGVLGALAWSSSGSAGPGRLETVGPNPLWVALVAAGVAAVAGLLGALAAAVRMPRGAASARAIDASPSDASPIAPVATESDPVEPASVPSSDGVSRREL